MEAQGYEIKRNILYQDNKSAILLETNGKSSSSPRTQAMNIRYFFLTDQIKQGNLEVEYVPTDDMIGNFSPNHSKENNSQNLRNWSWEIEPSSPLEQQECVERYQIQVTFQSSH